MEGWRIIQICEQKGTYNKEEFIQLINKLPQEQFNNFCREYWALLHFYDSNVNTYCTMQKDIVEENPKAFTRLAPIEGDLNRRYDKVI